MEKELLNVALPRVGEGDEHAGHSAKTLEAAKVFFPLQGDTWEVEEVKSVRLVAGRQVRRDAADAHNVHGLRFYAEIFKHAIVRRVCR